MRICPTCGYENEETATVCERCRWALPPPPISLPGAASRTRRQHILWFVFGAILGLIPAAIYALGAFTYGVYFSFYNSNNNGTIAGPGWPTIGCFLVPVVFIFMSIFVSIRRFRPFGYGLLAAALISPVVVGISCAVAPKV